MKRARQALMVGILVTALGLTGLTVDWNSAQAGTPAPLPVQIPIRDIDQPPTPCYSAQPFVPRPVRWRVRHKKRFHRRQARTRALPCPVPPRAQGKSGPPQPVLAPRRESATETIPPLDLPPAPAPIGPPPAPAPAPAPPASAGGSQEKVPRQDYRMGTTDHMFMGKDSQGNSVMEIGHQPKPPQAQPPMGPINVYPQVGPGGPPPGPPPQGNPRPGPGHQGQPQGQPQGPPPQGPSPQGGPAGTGS